MNEPHDLREEQIAAPLQEIPQPGSEPFRRTFILGISITAALGGLLFGFDTAVIAGTIPFFRAHFGLTEAALGWAVSSVLIGCMAGTVVAGRLSDRFGRKRMLMATAFIFAVSAIWTALAQSLPSMVMARMVGGLAVGTTSMLSPLYIAEVAPASIRGRLVSLNQLAIVLGILAAFFSNYLLVGMGEHNWRWMFGVETLPAMAFLAALFFVPETPRWLARSGNDAGALYVLRRIYGSRQAEKELVAIHEVLGGVQKGRFSDLRAPRLRPLLLVGVALAVFQQVTGINTVMYYAPMIFEQAGSATDAAMLQTVAVGLVNLAFTLVAIRTVDRVGRRPLLLFGSAAMMITLGLLSVAFTSGAFGGYVVLVLILAYIGSFAASLGPVVWVVISEIFPIKVRGLAVSVATFFLWASAFVISLTFPWLLAHLGGSGTFGIYAVLCAATFVFVWRFVPETRGKSLEEIERELVGTTY